MEDNGETSNHRWAYWSKACCVDVINLDQKICQSNIVCDFIASRCGFLHITSSRLGAESSPIYISFTSILPCLCKFSWNNNIKIRCLKTRLKFHEFHEFKTLNVRFLTPHERNGHLLNLENILHYYLESLHFRFSIRKYTLRLRQIPKSKIQPNSSHLKLLKLHDNHTNEFAKNWVRSRNFFWKVTGWPWTQNSEFPTTKLKTRAIWHYTTRKFVLKFVARQRYQILPYASENSKYSSKTNSISIRGCPMDTPKTRMSYWHPYVRKSERSAPFFSLDSFSF